MQNPEWDKTGYFQTPLSGGGEIQPIGEVPGYPFGPLIKGSPIQ